MAIWTFENKHSQIAPLTRFNRARMAVLKKHLDLLKLFIDFETDLNGSYIDTQKHVFKLKLFIKPSFNDIVR